MIAPILASQAITIVTGLLIKGAETITQGAAKDLWDSIKGIFRRNKKDEVLKKIENQPKDQEAIEEVKFELASMLQNDPSAKEQLEKYLQVYNASRTQNISQHITGSGNITAGGDMAGNTINYNSNK